MKKDLNINDDLFLKFFQNECSPEEHQQVITWMQDPGNDLLMKKWMFEHWNLFADQPQSDKPDIQKIWENLQKDLFPGENNEFAEPQRTRQKSIGQKSLRVFVIAASLLLILFSGWYFLTQPSKVSEKVSLFFSSDITKENTTTVSKDFELEDGSVVTLMPASKIRIPAHFSNNERRVCLEGEAFFKVTKNPSKPFYVFCQQVVTHVTGTSFNVKEDKIHNNVEVAVHSGTVEVYKTSDQHTEKENVTILTPNHKAIYSIQSSDTPSTALIEKPVLINNNYVDQNAVDNYYDSTRYFLFNYTIMSSVINALERAYGISIEVTNNKLLNCHFSGDLSKKGLYQKLDIINKALNTTYEINNTTVVIKGVGCD